MQICSILYYIAKFVTIKTDFNINILMSNLLCNSDSTFKILRNIQKIEQQR